MFRLRDLLKPRPDRSSRLINDDFRGTAVDIIYASIWDASHWHAEN